MHSKEEKLSLLSDLIDLVRSDHAVNEREYRFIRAVARQMHVEEEELGKLFSSQRPRFVVPVTEPERILHFQRLLLVMNIDRGKNANEIYALKDVSLRMGLNPVAVDQVLRVMDSYPDRIVPPKVMIEIFRVHYN
ncbi:TerB family tellurite resistance protein [Robertkochia flava]|uniref:TerB family tellurite resistance protein n=1 Tax=Robertkochia flava TaxID=3447986 RepID=UPI001CD02040|nr:TerB family tellurite resistance protein [Robertkochia marina]